MRRTDTGAMLAVIERLVNLGYQTEGLQSLLEDDSAMNAAHRRSLELFVFSVQTKSLQRSFAGLIIAMLVKLLMALTSGPHNHQQEGAGVLTPLLILAIMEFVILLLTWLEFNGGLKAFVHDYFRTLPLAIYRSCSTTAAMQETKDQANVDGGFTGERGVILDRQYDKLENACGKPSTSKCWHWFFCGCSAHLTRATQATKTWIWMFWLSFLASAVAIGFIATYGFYVLKRYFKGELSKDIGLPTALFCLGVILSCRLLTFIATAFSQVKVHDRSSRLYLGAFIVFLAAMSSIDMAYQYYDLCREGRDCNHQHTDDTNDQDVREVFRYYLSFACWNVFMMLICCIRLIHVWSRGSGHTVSSLCDTCCNLGARPLVLMEIPAEFHATATVPENAEYEIVAANADKHNQEHSKTVQMLVRKGVVNLKNPDLSEDRLRHLFEAGVPLADLSPRANEDVGPYQNAGYTAQDCRKANVDDEYIVRVYTLQECHKAGMTVADYHAAVAAWENSNPNIPVEDYVAAGYKVRDLIEAAARRTGPFTLDMLVQSQSTRNAAMAYGLLGEFPPSALLTAGYSGRDLLDAGVDLATLLHVQYHERDDEGKRIVELAEFADPDELKAAGASKSTISKAQKRIAEEPEAAAGMSPPRSQNERRTGQQSREEGAPEEKGR